MEEIQVLNILDHPNIVNHMESYDDTNFVFIGKLNFIITDILYDAWELIDVA